MNSTAQRLFWAGIFSLVLGTCAWADEYKDPSGFSLTIPEGWMAVNREAIKDVNNALPQELKDWVAKNNVDFDKISVLIIRNGKEDFLENLNVVVQDKEIPANNDTVKLLIGIMGKQYESMGLKVSMMQGAVKKVGNQAAIVVDYETKIPAVAQQVKQRQSMIPISGKTYIVTCSAKTSTFKKYLRTFEKVMDSLKVPAPGPVRNLVSASRGW